MYLADLHIHSKYSRATSANCDLAHLDLAARQKGIRLLGTGDFTHPAWREEMQAFLEPAEAGLYRLKPEYRLPGLFQGQPVSFVLSAEISCIYKRDGKVRKVHNVILLPSLRYAEELSERLEAIGNIRSDGRPILGLDSRDLLALTLNACPEAVFIPAHIWTPHFSMLGAFSGFDSPEECFGDLTPHIHAVETGLSSDPPMNWRVPSLDGFTLVSNSDAHSPAKLGREANLLDAELSYAGLSRALATGVGFCGTVEFFPEEGKYHLDGHRNCDLCLTPLETQSYAGKCPVCGKKLTVGVLSRVERLAERPEGARPSSPKPFWHLVPLLEVIADVYGVSAAGAKAESIYAGLLDTFGTEFEILQNLPLSEISRCGEGLLAEGIRRLRAGEVYRKAGYDGAYGVISLFAPGERARLSGQISFLAPGLAKAEKKLPPRPADSLPQAQPSNSEATNPEQEAAVRCESPIVAVSAGPGTGKTYTLVARAAYLIREKGVNPREITAVTFTNQAGRELRDRLNAALGDRRGERITCGTFHAICLELLSKQGLTLIDRSEAFALAGEVLRALGEKITPLRFLQEVSAVKNGIGKKRHPEAFDAYCRRLEELGALDFDDLIAEAIKRDFSGDKRFTHLMVDEFQDVNPLQYELVRSWSGKGRTLFAIGDPDQSIYGFRGGSADCFRKLAEDFPDLAAIRLARNYRSAPELIAAGYSLISHNPGEHTLLTATRESRSGPRIVEAESDLSEAIYIAKEINRMAGGLDMLGAQAGDEARGFSEIAVLCRTHRHAELIESCLQKEGVPCTVSGREGFLDEPEVRGTLGFFRSLISPCDRPSLRAALLLLWRLPAKEAETFAAAIAAEKEPIEAAAAICPGYAEAAAEFFPRLSQKPKKLLDAWAKRMGIATPTYERLQKAASLYSDLSAFLDNLLLGGERDVGRAGNLFRPDAVRLLTLHAAKGLEFAAVFLAGASLGQIPLSFQDTDVAEERRLFYVGMTRARDELVLTYSGRPSPFLGELPADTVREKLRRRPEGKQLSLF